MTALDTNVLIYACDKSDPRRQQIALELIATVTDGVLLWQVACEFVAASRKLNDRGFTPIDAWNRLTEFLDVFHRGYDEFLRQAIKRDTSPRETRMCSSTARHSRRSPMSRAYPWCSLFERLTHTEEGLGRQTPSA